VSVARDSKPAKIMTKLSRVVEELDRHMERAEVPAALAAQPPDSRAGRQSQMGAALDALDAVEVVDALDALDAVEAVDTLDAAQPKPASRSSSRRCCTRTRR